MSTPPTGPHSLEHPIALVFSDDLENQPLHAAGSAPQDSTRTVSLNDLAPNTWNPHEMTTAEMDALIDSVRQDGQWRPILAVAMDAPDETEPEVRTPYRIVDGFHLYKALASLHQEGFPNTAKVLVIGNNSELPVWKQQLIGQTINHGLRGTVEDPAKTQRLLNNLLQHADKKLLARRLAIGEAGLSTLAKGPPASVSRGASALAGAVKSTPYAERRNYITALSFDTPDKQSRFDALLDAVAPQYLDESDYRGRRGQLRVDALMCILEDLQEQD